MTQGVITTAIARTLAIELKPQNLDVLYGHGQAGVDPIGRLGKLRSWFSPDYGKGTILADLDIAIVLRGTDRLIALIEIEETSNNPKLLIGDVLATLMGDHITFREKRNLQLGPWTTLIILAHTASPAGQNRIVFLETQVNQIKSTLTTPNASIGRVVMNNFQNEEELGTKLRMHIQTAVVNSRENGNGI